MEKQVNLKTIYYRGLLRSCNYKCSYCPFHFPHHSDFSADENALKRFCERIHEQDGKLTVMFVPQGEALIQEYYHHAIAALCGFDNISIIGCQTNLSFDVKKLSSIVTYNSFKLSLWCTFHPSRVSLSDFLKQCERLIEGGIKFCVGAVGAPAAIPVLKELRRKLPSAIYMWINILKGLSNYTNDDLEVFSDLDPLFRLELENYPADPALCIAGRESIFVEGNGDYFACNISKVKLGNFYREEKIVPPKICLSKKCSCFLAYSNRIELRDMFWGDDVISVRNPKLVIY